VAERLKSIFAPAYLTLISILQGVALTFLAAQVEAGYLHFDGVAWALVVATLVTYVVVWTEYVQVVATYVWFPNLSDAITPFALATLELLLAHFAVRGTAGLRSYLLVGYVTSLLGAWAFVQLGVRAASPRAEADNRDMHHALDRPRALRIGQQMANAVLTFAVWAVYDAAGLGRFALLIAVGYAILSVANLLGTVPYWNQVVTYAEAG
jgi:hypothetical protein